MAEDKPTEGGATDAAPKKLSAKDLKARLGLNKKKAASFVPQPKPMAKVAPDEPSLSDDDTLLQADEQGLTPAAAQAVEAARQRSQAALEEAGPAIEDFSMLGQQHTPIPAALPAAPIAVTGAADDYPGRAKKQRLTFIALGVGVGVVAFFFGNLMGSAGEQRSQRDAYVREARDMRKMVLNAKSADGKVADRIAALKDQLRITLEKVDAAGEGAGVEALQAPFAELLPVLAKFQNDQVYVDPVGVMGEDLKNSKLMKTVLAYAANTQALYEQVGYALDEAKTHLRAASPPPNATRVVLLQEDTREVDELGTIPVGTGAWVKNTGQPAKVKMIDPKTGDAAAEEWQQMVLLDGATDPVQVPTKNVMSLDLAPIYQEQAKRLTLLSINRLVMIARQLEARAATIQPQRVETALAEWADKEEL